LKVVLTKGAHNNNNVKRQKTKQWWTWRYII
jgi:hypothetical protein